MPRLRPATSVAPHRSAWRSALVLLALPALLAAPATSPAAAAGAEKRLRTIHVSGVGEVTAVPDMALVTLGVETRAATARAALSDNTSAMRRIFGLLKKKWRIAERDMQTSEFSVSPVYAQKRSQDGTVVSRLVGYRVGNMLTVRVRKLEDLGGILDAVVSAGGNRIHNVRFVIADTAALHQEARRRAVRDALARARVIAEEAGFTLGPVLKVNEGGIITPRPVYMERAMRAAAAPPVPMARGEQKLTVTINMTLEIR